MCYSYFQAYVLRPLRLPATDPGRVSRRLRPAPLDRRAGLHLRARSCGLGCGLGCGPRPVVVGRRGRVLPERVPGQRPRGGHHRDAAQGTADGAVDDSAGEVGRRDSNFF